MRREILAAALLAAAATSARAGTPPTLVTGSAGGASHADTPAAGQGALVSGSGGEAAAASPSAPPALVTGTAGAAEAAEAPVPTPTPLAEARASTFVIVGTPVDTARIAGSAQVIGEEELEAFEYEDIHRVLQQVPGVYVRGEDGYGLRPNIGLRGANSDRSAKVTLMEDGVLLAPAPYSAPAAYYFPMVTRMRAVEVYKGPASIAFGPNTVGGAINMLTAPIPSSGAKADFDLGAGQHMFGKVHGDAGWGDLRKGFLFQGVHLQTDGYKRLDGGGPTGFDKNDLMLKAFYGTPMEARVYQRVDVKLGFATERSNETYLGLSDEDFRASPIRRYAASQRDLMRWGRSQAQVSHFVATGLFDVTTTAYRHDFDRRWRKLNRFHGGPALADVLANPDGGQNAVYAAILRGEADSTVAAQNLMVGTNHRVFVSQGLQSVAHARAAHGAFTHVVEVGARLHHDHIDRMHTEDPYRMTAGELVHEGSPRLTNVDSRASATALALHATDELRIGRWLFSPGARFEWIETAFRDRRSGERMRSVDTVVLPGLGAFVDLGKGLGLLAGVHEGFSPVSPGQPDAVKPERSLNLEAGARWTRPSTRAELIGFYNDYFNLTGECTFSGGCTGDLNDQFNGGAVDVYGVEAVFGQAFPLPLGLDGRIDLSWTWTRSSFRTGFESGHPQWGDVEIGDELPYVPEHLATATWRFGRARWFASASVSHVSAMREEAGQGTLIPSESTDAHTIVDLAAHVKINGRGELYLSVDNVLDEAYIASRRPYGARPGKPREMQLGFKYRFGI